MERDYIMLKEQKYGFEEMKKIMGCSDKQGIDRKLDRYKITYESSGRGQSRTYTILHISDPFKTYCVLKLGIPAQADFDKILHLYYYFFCCDDFKTSPIIEQERMMSESDGAPVSRKTITKWLNYLEKINYISFDRVNCLYYLVRKEIDGQQTYIETDRETYNKGWKIYFEYKDKEGCGPAYGRMYNFLGGHPYKKSIAYENALLQSDIDELIELINDTYLNRNNK